MEGARIKYLVFYLMKRKKFYAKLFCKILQKLGQHTTFFKMSKRVAHGIRLTNGKFHRNGNFCLRANKAIVHFFDSEGKELTVRKKAIAKLPANRYLPPRRNFLNPQNIDRPCNLRPATEIADPP